MFFSPLASEDLAACLRPAFLMPRQAENGLFTPELRPGNSVARNSCLRHGGAQTARCGTCRRSFSKARSRRCGPSALRDFTRRPSAWSARKRASGQRSGVAFVVCPPAGYSAPVWSDCRERPCRGCPAACSRLSLAQAHPLTIRWFPIAAAPGQSPGAIFRMARFCASGTPRVCPGGSTALPSALSLSAQTSGITAANQKLISD